MPHTNVAHMRTPHNQRIPGVRSVRRVQGAPGTHHGAPAAHHGAHGAHGAPDPPQRTTRPTGAGAWYIVAAVATSINADTSWRFFGLLGIDGAERWVMFSVVEMALVACGWSMRAAVRRGDRPGPARILAWVLCGYSAYMAVVLSGPVRGTARVLLGCFLGIVSLHLALGIEIQAKRSKTAAKTPWARVLSEMRERALSRLGLGDDSRDAVTRTQDRAADRAARLAASRYAPFRGVRLRRALRVARVHDDPVRSGRLLRQLAVHQHASSLSGMVLPSPWGEMQHGAPAAQHPTQHGAPAAQHPTQHGAPAAQHGAPPRKPRRTTTTPKPGITDKQLTNTLHEYVTHCTQTNQHISKRHLVKLAKTAHPGIPIGTRRCSRIAEQITKGGTP